MKRVNFLDRIKSQAGKLKLRLSRKKGEPAGRTVAAKKEPGRGVRLLFAFFCVLAVICAFTVPVGATTATDNALTVINNLSDFIFSVINAIGMILVGWGIVQVGLSLQSHDPSQRSNGFLTLAGGVIVMCAESILDLIT